MKHFRFQVLAGPALRSVLMLALLSGIVSEAQVPQDQLRPLSGPPVSLKELQGKVVVLAFGGTWVPLFGRELGSLQRLATRYESRQVAVYWVSIDSDRPGTRNHASDEQLQAFLKRSNLRLPVLRDPEMATYRAFELTAVPTIVLLDQRGQVVRKYIGIDTEQGEVYTALIAEIERLIR